MVPKLFDGFSIVTGRCCRGDTTSGTRVPLANALKEGSVLVAGFGFFFPGRIYQFEDVWLCFSWDKNSGPAWTPPPSVVKVDVINDQFSLLGTFVCRIFLVFHCYRGSGRWEGGPSFGNSRHGWKNESPQGQGFFFAFWGEVTEGRCVI